MRKVYILGLIGLASLIIGLAWAEQLTFTTYYPAPYGVYNDMEVKNQLEIEGEAIFVKVTQGSPLGSSPTIDWTTSNKQEITLDSDPTTLTFTAPNGACNLVLIIKDTAGRIINWPPGGLVKWAGGSAPTLTPGAAGIDIVSFYFDGTNYYGAASLDFQ